MSERDSELSCDGNCCLDWRGALGQLHLYPCQLSQRAGWERAAAECARAEALREAAKVVQSKDGPLWAMPGLAVKVAKDIRALAAEPADDAGEKGK